jgi:hypothetical protein
MQGKLFIIREGSESFREGSESCSSFGRQGKLFIRTEPELFAVGDINASWT